LQCVNFGRNLSGRDVKVGNVSELKNDLLYFLKSLLNRRDLVKVVQAIVIKSVSTVNKELNPFNQSLHKIESGCDGGYISEEGFTGFLILAKIKGKGILDQCEKGKMESTALRRLDPLSPVMKALHL
jgi:hypothetical protein